MLKDAERWWKMVRPYAEYPISRVSVQWGCKNASRCISYICMKWCRKQAQMLVKSGLSKNERKQFWISASSTSSTPSTCKIQTFVMPFFWSWSALHGEFFANRLLLLLSSQLGPLKNRKKIHSSSKTKTVIADYGLGQGFGTRTGAGICWNILGYFHVGTMWAPCGHHGMYLLHPFKSLTFLVEDRGPVSPPREPDKSSENKANLRFLYVSFSAN